MKILKKKMICFGIMAVGGIALSVVSMMQGVNSTIIGFASGIMAVSIVKLIQFYRISKSPQLLKKFEIEQKEERLITIAEKSGRFAFMLTLITEFAAIFVLILNGQNDIATILSTIAGIQTFAYLATYYYLCKKY